MSNKVSMRFINGMILDINGSADTENPNQIEF